MKICVMTLGCKVNKYESDALVKRLEEKGYQTTDNLEQADIYVINTCAVTAEAEKKSRQMIARCRKFNPNARVLICGCASQKNQMQFKEKGVEVVTGVAGKTKLIDIIEQGNVDISELPLQYEDDMLAKQSRIRAYIKIQDGCNNFCSYCIIPYLRGRSRSRSLESIMAEASALGEDIKEIVLTGINVTDYKIDGKPGLLTLLQNLDTLGKRIRLSSLEETLVSEEFAKGLSELQNFCPHFHLSLQSGCDSVLKSMNRKYTTKEFYNSVQLLRKYFPLAAITTDVIVGFPGESDEEFEATRRFIEKVGFASLHIFKYSHRDGTVASRMTDLPDGVKSQRSDILESVKAKLFDEFIKKNKTGKVLIEEFDGQHYVGYTENYIKCYIQSDKDLVNQIVDVEIGERFKDGVKARLDRPKKVC